MDGVLHSYKLVGQDGFGQYRKRLNLGVAWLMPGCVKGRRVESKVKVLQLDTLSSEIHSPRAKSRDRSTEEARGREDAPSILDY